jgi:DNA repair protein RadC
MTASSLPLFDAQPFQAPTRPFPVAETVALYGPEALSDAQIIEAMLNRVRPGRAELVLQQAGSMARLVSMGPSELQALGLTKAEMARFAILQEVHRRSTRGGFDRPKIASPRAAGAYLLPKVQGWTEERFGMLALGAKGDLLADRTLSQGTATATLISPREFFREALRFGATSALAWHNHPSSDPTPSREDVALTGRLRAAGESLGVPLADHMILGGDRWHSFRAAEGWDR